MGEIKIKDLVMQQVVQPLWWLVGDNDGRLHKGGILVIITITVLSLSLGTMVAHAWLALIVVPLVVLSLSLYITDEALRYAKVNLEQKDKGLLDLHRKVDDERRRREDNVAYYRNHIKPEDHAAIREALLAAMRVLLDRAKLAHEFRMESSDPPSKVNRYAQEERKACTLAAVHAASVLDLSHAVLENTVEDHGSPVLLKLFLTEQPGRVRRLHADFPRFVHALRRVSEQGS